MVHMRPHERARPQAPSIIHPNCTVPRRDPNPNRNPQSTPPKSTSIKKKVSKHFENWYMLDS